MIILTISKYYYTFTKLMFNKCIIIKNNKYICCILNI